MDNIITNIFVNNLVRVSTEIIKKQKNNANDIDNNPDIRLTNKYNVFQYKLPDLLHSGIISLKGFLELHKLIKIIIFKFNDISLKNIIQQSPKILNNVYSYTYQQVLDEYIEAYNSLMKNLFKLCNSETKPIEFDLNYNESDRTFTVILNGKLNKYLFNIFHNCVSAFIKSKDETFQKLFKVISINKIQLEINKFIIIIFILFVLMYFSVLLNPTIYLSNDKFIISILAGSILMLQYSLFTTTDMKLVNFSNLIKNTSTCRLQEIETNTLTLTEISNRCNINPNCVAFDWSKNNDSNLYSNIASTCETNLQYDIDPFNMIKPKFYMFNSRTNPILLDTRIGEKYPPINSILFNTDNGDIFIQSENGRQYLETISTKPELDSIFIFSTLNQVAYMQNFAFEPHMKITFGEIIPKSNIINVYSITQNITTEALESIQLTTLFIPEIGLKPQITPDINISGFKYRKHSTFILLSSIGCLLFGTAGILNNFYK